MKLCIFLMLGPSSAYGPMCRIWAAEPSLKVSNRSLGSAGSFFFLDAISMEIASKKKKLPALPKLRFETFNEGSAAQILHIGPYAEEGPNIKKIHSFIKETGHVLSGKHHEIYLSDSRKAAPEKLKTIVRQPMK